jgi:hypothetical protein
VELPGGRIRRWALIDTAAHTETVGAAPGVHATG